MFTPLPDFSLVALLMYSLFYGSIAIILVILVEASALWLLQWDSLLRSLRDSTLANIVTTGFGLSLYIFFAPNWLDIFDESRFTSNMFILWALSSIVESVVFYLISEKRFRSTILTSCMINLCSYIPLSLWIDANLLN